MATITYYNIDGYETKQGVITFIDEVYKTITIVDTKILIKNIIDVKCSEIKEFNGNFE